MTTTNSHDFSETAPPPPVSKQWRQAPVWRRRGVQVLLLAALLIALLAIFALASSEADEGDVMVASGNSAQNSHSATLLTDGHVLVAGGWSGTTAIANADLRVNNPTQNYGFLLWLTLLSRPRVDENKVIDITSSAIVVVAAVAVGMW